MRRGGEPALVSITRHKNRVQVPDGKKIKKKLSLIQSSHLFEVDESGLHVRMNKLNTDSVAYIDAMKTLHELAFNGWMGKAHPCAFRRGAGDDSIEIFSDP